MSHGASGMRESRDEVSEGNVPSASRDTHTNLDDISACPFDVLVLDG